jgi:hypothetical protein
MHGPAAGLLRTRRPDRRTVVLSLMVLATDDHKLLYLCDRDHLDAVTIVQGWRPSHPLHVVARRADQALKTAERSSSRI